MHSITLNQNWKIVRVTLDPPQKGPSRKGNEPIILYPYPGTGPARARAGTDPNLLTSLKITRVILFAKSMDFG